MPLGYEIFSGNTTDVTTVKQIVETMESRFGKANRVWVMDRGMVSAENIAWLNNTERRYVIGTARTRAQALGQRARGQDRLAPDSRRCRSEDLPLGLTAARLSCCVARPAVSRKSRRCMSGSPSASKKGLESSRPTHREEQKAARPWRAGTPDRAVVGKKLTRGRALHDCDRRG